MILACIVEVLIALIGRGKKIQNLDKLVQCKYFFNWKNT